MRGELCVNACQGIETCNKASNQSCFPKQHFAMRKQGAQMICRSKNIEHLAPGQNLSLFVCVHETQTL